MSHEPGAEFAAWMDAYQMASADAAKVSSLPCPRCAQTFLNVVYVVRDEASERGTGVFWCGHCLIGLTPLNALVPVGGRRVLAGAEHVPNYALVVDDSIE